MSVKNISFQIGNVEDTVISIGTDTPDCTVQELVDNAASGYFLVENENGQTDLCKEVADTTPDIEANLTEYSTGNPYKIMSYDFVPHENVIGGRPHVRCPKCVF